jgi:hypothetical protein
MCARSQASAAMGFCGPIRMDGKMEERMDSDDGKMGSGKVRRELMGLLTFANDLFGSKKRRGDGTIFV